MKPGWTAYGAVAAAGLLSGSAASPVVKTTSDIALRAFPNAPNGYAPADVNCPSTRPTVRSAARLSPSERDWLEQRRSKTTDALVDFFGHVEIPNFDAAGYIRQHRSNVSLVPNIGIAVSGGGYRALMNGGGALSAFDSRTENSTTRGHLGGLLQSATYLSGLSGGGWLVGSIYLNNFTTVPNLQYGDDGSVWEFEQSILEGPEESGIDLINSIDYYREIMRAVDSKRNAGYEVSITDYWGRALSYQLINDSQGGLNYTWSSIALSDSFSNADMPMPILVADGRNPGELLITGNATVFEFNPFEFGTFDPTVFGFVPLEFLGSRFVAGRLPENESCVRGFDNAGFIMGTSSSLFNQFALNMEQVDLPDFIESAINDILESIGDDNNDIAEYRPNPFYLYSNESSPFADVESLPLVDGGEDLQNIPLHPLIQPERHVDVIFAVDSSADTDNNWPNGTALVATYQRSLNSTGIANGTAFPAIPDQNTFVNLGLNNRPTFFGCDSSNMTGPSPLVVYIPNAPYVAWSNVSTFTLAYPEDQRNHIIQNGYEVATMGNATRDEDWPTCVGCAILSRSFERTGTNVPDACRQCFDRYCWDGTVNSTAPAPYSPDMILAEIGADSGAVARYTSSMLCISATIAAVVVNLL
ncbi:hypothetical protein VTO42DRAFT_1262 [Malbranchea cinnamomea]